MSKLTKLSIWIGAAVIGGAFLSFLFLTKTDSTAKALSIGYFYVTTILVVFVCVHRFVATKLTVFSQTPQLILRSLLYTIALSFGYLVGFVFQTILLLPMETVQEAVINNVWKGLVYVISSPFGTETTTDFFSPELRTISITFFALIFLIGLVSIVGSVVEVRWQESKQRQAVERAELNALRAENERQLLEVDNIRKTQELEEARELQLSMLPRKIPDAQDLEISVHMQTATEVGGDYYDFLESKDGRLTAAIGDATGHGAKAGIMVTAAKSLFNVLGHEADLLHALDKINACLVNMNLGLYMSMTLVRFEAGKVRIATAGMPPTLIYHHQSKTIEEVVIKGMPLGAHPDFPYEEREVALDPGDVVLLMSDGFPELFNENNEMLDYTRSVEVLRECATRSPREIIDHFVQAGNAWRQTRAQDDDITFVAIRAS